MPPGFWSRYVWALLHGLAQCMDTLVEQKKTIFTILEVAQFLRAFSLLLPCGECRHHFNQMLQGDFQKINCQWPKSGYFQWTVSARARIAARLGSVIRTEEYCRQKFDPEWFAMAWNALQIMSFSYPLVAHVDIQNDVDFFFRFVPRIFPNADVATWDRIISSYERQLLDVPKPKIEDVAKKEETPPTNQLSFEKLGFANLSVETENVAQSARRLQLSHVLTTSAKTSPLRSPPHPDDVVLDHLNDGKIVWCSTRENFIGLVYRLRVEAQVTPKFSVPPLDAIVQQWTTELVRFITTWKANNDKVIELRKKKQADDEKIKLDEQKTKLDKQKTVQLMKEQFSVSLQDMKQKLL